MTTRFNRSAMGANMIESMDNARRFAMNDYSDKSLENSAVAPNGTSQTSDAVDQVAKALAYTGLFIAAGYFISKIADVAQGDSEV